MKYKAFISYKHVASSAFAENLELAIKAYAKPIWRPPMPVFRDEKYLRPGIDLPGLIQRALSDSEYLIYLASPDAAQSSWIRDELQFWCSDEGRLQRLIVVLTDGTIVADPETKRVDWAKTDALPEMLSRKIEFIPLYVDLAWACSSEQQSLLNPDYKKAINSIVAALRDIDPIELSGVEILQHRRNVRVRNAFIGSIAALAIGSAVVAGVAWNQMRKAQWQAIYSESLRLAESDPNLAARELRSLSANADIAAAPLAWRLINATPIWTVAEFRGHGDQIWSLGFDPGNRRLATGGGDGTVRLWDIDGARPPLVLDGHKALVLDLDFAPDGQRVATVAEDDATRIWDALTGGLLKEIPVEQGQVNQVAFNPAGSGFMTVSYRRVRLHDDDRSARTLAEVPRLIDAAWRPDGKAIVTASAEAGIGAQLHQVDGIAQPLTLEGTDETGSYAVTFSPDGAILVVICLDGTLRLFRSSDGAALQTLRPEVDTSRREKVISFAKRLVAFSRDGTLVAGAFADRLAIWPISSPENVRVLTHEGAVKDFELDKEGQRIITLDSNGNTRLWTLDGAGKYQPMVLQGHADVNRVAFTPDGQHLVTGAGDGSIRLWVFRQPMRPVIPLNGHEGPVHFASFNPDGSTVVTASDDGTARIWRTMDGRAVATLRPGRAGHVHTAAFSPDGERIVVAGKAGAYLWAADGSGEPVRFHNAPVKAAAFSADGDRLIVVTGSQHIEDAGAVILYSPDGKRRLGSFKGQGRISRFAPLSPDADRVITFLPAKRQAFVYDLQNEAKPKILDGHEELLLDASFSPDGHYVVTASSDWTIRLWEAETGRELDVFKGAGTEVEIARFSPDGTRILTSSAEHMIRLWDMDGRIVRKMQAAGQPEHIAFTDDGNAVLVAENYFDEHFAVRVVDTVEQTNPILLTGHTQRILHAAFSPDARRVVTTSKDGTARIYAIDWPTLRNTLMKRSPTIYEGSDWPESVR